MNTRTEITTVLFSHFNLAENKSEFRFAHDDWGIGEEDIIIEKEFKVYIETPKMSKEELALKAIKTLKDKQQKIRAESYMRAQELQEKINQLLALPFLKSLPAVD